MNVDTRHVIAVLSGGGAKGAVHVGAVKAMEEHRVRPDRYVGTSMGAVVAAAFASGLTYDDVLQRVSNVSRRDVATLSLGTALGVLAPSLLQGRRFRDTIETLVPARRFDELATPLTVTAVDARTGELVLFGDGGESSVALVDALYASCALPVYYPAARIGNREFLDGGLRAVLPLDEALEFGPSHILAVSVGPSLRGGVTMHGVFGRGIIGAHRRALRIMMAIQTEAVVQRWRQDPPVPCTIIAPEVDGSATFSVERVAEFVEVGYRAMYRAIDDTQWVDEPTVSQARD